MAGVMTSPADFVSQRAEVMPTLNNNRCAFGSIQHFFTVLAIYPHGHGKDVREINRDFCRTRFFCLETMHFLQLSRVETHGSGKFSDWYGQFPGALSCSQKLIPKKKHRTREKNYGYVKFFNESSKTDTTTIFLPK
jgi:hypothetical protein